MKQIELVEKRKEREKHFLQEDGTIVATIYDRNVHYLKDGKYEDIDNSLIEDGDFYINKSNAYSIKFKNKDKNDLIKMEVDNHFLDIKFNNMISSSEKSRDLSIDKSTAIYKNIINNVDLEYRVLPTKVKESIIIKDKENIPKELTFHIKTDLKLNINPDNSIIATSQENKIFKIDSPYMCDSSGLINNNICYKLNEDNNMHILKLILDTDWLMKEEISYPVVIDPTITNLLQDSSVKDTYIYPGDTGVNKNAQDILKAGVEKKNGSDVVNRTLIKFELPNLGTGSQVIDAKMILIGYHTTSNEPISHIMEIRRVTAPWTEENANWSNMSTNFDSSRVDGAFYAYRSYMDSLGIIYPQYCIADLTDLVKNWYKNNDNNGIMIKTSNEIYTTDNIAAFYSKNNTFNDFNPKPLLQITYRNQNGLESYMKYSTQNLTNGKSYINLYNGNMTFCYDVGRINSLIMPMALKLYYNTNDVVLTNNYDLGIGFKFNIYQTIKKIQIDDTDYLELLDEDGTLHYFSSTKKTYDENGTINQTQEQNTYYDEDGLELSIKEFSNYYLLTDKYDTIMRFNKNSSSSYLSSITDSSGHQCIITYDTSNRITEITASNNESITIQYGTNTITITSPFDNVVLTYSNDKPVSITSNLGTTTLQYNSQNLISKIIDVSGKSISFDYYSKSPYKVQQISEYGTSNNLGRKESYNYKFSSTTVKDNENKVQTYTFNKYGNVSSITNLENTSNLKNAYGKYMFFGEMYQDKNKKNLDEVLIQYIKNYIDNSYFENNNVIFSAINDVSLSISNDYSYVGSNSLKAISNGTTGVITKSYNLPKREYYTFSAYIKSNTSLKLSLSYLNAQNVEVTVVSDTILASDSFERNDVTIYYPADATSQLNLKVLFLNSGTSYLDALQLERGEIANIYNYIENSDFSNGITGWQTYGNSGQFEVVNLNNDAKALKIKMLPADSTSVQKTINISGSANDVYTISFWFKNEGLHSDAVDAGDSIYNNVSVYFNYNDDYGQGIPLSLPLEINSDEWQFFTCNFVATRDYNAINLLFLQILNANDLYITNICLYKNISSNVLQYDENGNVKKISTMLDDEISLKYNQDNQLIKLVDSTGKYITYEYDNVLKEKIKSESSNMGITSLSKYNLDGMLDTLKIINTKQNSNIVTGYYKIRMKGTDNYLKVQNLELVISPNSDEYSKWYVEAVSWGSETYYKIKYPLISGKYISVETNTADLFGDDENYNLFSFIKNDNGSYYIKARTRDYYLKSYDSELFLHQFVENDPTFEFILENCDYPNFIEKNYIYSLTGNSLSKYINELNLPIKYVFDEASGLMTQKIDQKGTNIECVYNNKNQITQMSYNDRVVAYTYNTQNLISKVSIGNIDYNFFYNEFGRVTSIKIGNNITLSTSSYMSYNGNKESTTYGNGNQITYTYDEFNRIKTINRTDDSFKYIYDNSGNLAKVVSSNDIKRYYYDFTQMLIQYLYDNFKVKYGYNSNGNLTSKQISLDNIIHSIEYSYNLDNSQVSTTIDNSVVNYEYDYLGRIINISINNMLNNSYEYRKNGKRTSTIVKKYIVGNDEYSLKYDKDDNITHIYKNGVLENRYFYDQINELIREDNFKYNTSTRIKYDQNGNILHRKIYNLNTFELIETMNYGYTDSNWSDKLTSFNGNTISYDNSGNPLTISSGTTLEWDNGYQLAEYSDLNNTILYKYDENGLRTKKIVNNNEIYYYYEGKDLLFEKNGNNVIYYLRDDTLGLIGLKYNNSIYYYVKSVLGDILGIVDSNYSLVGKYEYDALGNIISITDGNNIDISTNPLHIANINPYRYRSYYYDQETKLYYLNNRYYNPEWGRFLSIDNTINANGEYLGHNLYAYVNNNFVNAVDNNGRIFKKIAKAAWKLVSKALKKAFNMPISSETLKHSTKSNPKDIVYDKNSYVAKAIQEDSTYKQALNDAIKSADENGVVDYHEVKLFSGRDLQGSFHNATINITGTVINNEVDLKVNIHDRYDFEPHLYSYYDGLKGFIFTFGNNMAWSDQYFGVINNYNIDVNFDFKYCLR